MVSCPFVAGSIVKIDPKQVVKGPMITIGKRRVQNPITELTTFVSFNEIEINSRVDPKEGSAAFIIDGVLKHVLLSQMNRLQTTFITFLVESEIGNKTQTMLHHHTRDQFMKGDPVILCADCPEPEA